MGNSSIAHGTNISIQVFDYLTCLLSGVCVKEQRIKKLEILITLILANLLNVNSILLLLVRTCNLMDV